MTRRWTNWLGILCCLTLAACAASRPARFYTLSPMQMEDGQKGKLSVTDVLSVGVGPVDLPAYLDRPQIVTREDPNQLRLAEFDQWVEPLNEMVPRVLVEDLDRLLMAKGLIVQPWHGVKGAMDCQVVVDILRLDGALGKSVHLVAVWGLYDVEGRRLVPLQESVIGEKVEGSGFKALVAAESRTLEELSRRIAAAIEKSLLQRRS